jgi:hypothetical protein
MTNHRFKKAARKNRTKALFFTILFHVALLGGIAYSTGSDVKAYLPDGLLEMMGMEKQEVALEEAVRP